MDSTKKIEQRWIRPISRAPGVWKQQLPTKLLAYAAKGMLGDLKTLLKQHPDWISKRGSHNRTFLWEAVRGGHSDVVTWLIDQGADVNATGSYNSESLVQLTPMAAAVYYNNHHLLSSLEGKAEQHDIFRLTFLGHEDEVHAVLRKSPQLLNAEDPHDDIYYIPLISFAIAGKQQALFDVLIRRQPDLIQYSDQLAFLATKFDEHQMLSDLLEEGIDLKYCDNTVLMVAKDTRFMKYLLDNGVQVNRIGRNKLPPLSYLVRGDKGEHPEKVKIVLDYGANINYRDYKGRTALHIAARAGFADVVEMLLEHGADPTVEDLKGKTALDMAINKDHRSVMNLLG